MSEPATYHGVPYTLARGLGLRPGPLGFIDETWYGIALIDGRPEVIYEGRRVGIHYITKAEALKEVKAEICARLGIPGPLPSGLRRKAAKLRRMTVARGCTPAEAANAKAMLKKLERRA
jgi:hypothetical protein